MSSLRSRWFRHSALLVVAALASGCAQDPVVEDAPPVPYRPLLRGVALPNAGKAAAVDDAAPEDAAPEEAGPEDAGPVAVAVHPPLTLPLSAEDDERDGNCEFDDEMNHTAIPRKDRLYATWQTFTLNPDADGNAATLRVLNDARFTRPGSDRVGTHIMLPPCDSLPGRIEVLDASGAPQQALSVAPQTDVVAHVFPAEPHDATLFEVIERVQCLASCWCGDRHSFWQLIDGELKPLTANYSGVDHPVAGVTHGCYEGSVISGGAGAALTIHRTAMGGMVSGTETVTWDGHAWQGKSVDRKEY